MPADARREPPSHDAGHGQGRPPDGPPEEGSWAFARGLKSMFGWSPSQAAPALPPLTSSGQQAPSEYGPLLDGGVHRPSVPDPAHTRANVVAAAGLIPRAAPPVVAVLTPVKAPGRAEDRSLRSQCTSVGLTRPS